MGVIILMRIRVACIVLCSISFLSKVSLKVPIIYFIIRLIQNRNKTNFNYLLSAAEQFLM